MKIIKIILTIVFVLALFSLSRITAHASDCLDVLPSGSLVLTTSCSFSGTVNGVDSGIDSTNSAILTLGTGSILTILPGQTIAVGSVSFKGGSLVKMSGGTLVTRTPLWMVDADVDGYPVTTDQYAQSTPPVGARRRNTQISMVSIDKNDGYYCPDSYNPNVTCNECSGGGLSYQPDGTDLYSQCTAFSLCDGAGQCSLRGKRVFVSSTSYNGNLGGLAGADQTCQTLADSTSLNGTWKAWLSDSTTNVSDRFTHSGYPYLLVDKITKIADNWSNLTASASLSAMINMTETGTIDSKADVWTNTNSNGLSVGSTPTLTCNDWNSNNKKSTGIYGKNKSYTSGQWSNFSSSACSKQNSLYCFEQ